MNQKEKWECFLHLCLMYFWQLQKASLKISHISQVISCAILVHLENLMHSVVTEWKSVFIHVCHFLEHFCLLLRDSSFMDDVHVLYFSALMMTCCCRSISCVQLVFFIVLYSCFYWFHLKKHFFIKFISANSQWLYQWETGSV